MTLAHGARVWRSHRDFVECTGRSISIAENAVRLRRGIAVADEMGNCSLNDRESVLGLRQAERLSSFPYWQPPVRCCARFCCVTVSTENWKLR